MARKEDPSGWPFEILFGISPGRPFESAIRKAIRKALPGGSSHAPDSFGYLTSGSSRGWIRWSSAGPPQRETIKNIRHQCEVRQSGGLRRIGRIPFFIILSFICFYFFVRFISTSGKTSKKCLTTRSCILQLSTLNCGEATLQGPMLIRWSVCWSMKTEQFTFRHIRTGETTPSIHCIVHTVLFLHCDEVSNHRWHPFPSHPEMKRGTILF